jgi:ankyrin repeat protein
MDPTQAFAQALGCDNVAEARRLVAQHPELRAQLIASAPVPRARSRAMLDLLLETGADLNAKTDWWAGGFGLLHHADPDLADYAIERGALIDVHAAARLGRLDHLRALLDADPLLVRAPGGDGQTPLHFAKTREVAALLFERGAPIDARDVDHESTPAQYMLGDRLDVARFLVERGCQTDLLMAAALGDSALARRLVDADPASLRLRVSDEFFPMVGGRAGGTIYQWTLGWYVSPHEVARARGHLDLFHWLMDRSPDDVKLLVACWTADEALRRSLLARAPDLVAGLPPAERRHLAHAVRNNNSAAARAMMQAGWPVDVLGQHQATPLHWAAFHGNAELTRELLRFTPPLEKTDADFQGTPLGWAIHGSEHGWHRETGDYPETVAALLDAGANPAAIREGGSEPVRALLRQRARSTGSGQASLTDSGQGSPPSAVKTG